MLFPTLHVPVAGSGMLIGLVAVTHVLISHGFAIGGIGLIVVLEHLAWSRRDAELEGVARAMLKPAVIIITAVGAMTGVGIWFTLSALAPAGIGSMLRVFFWPWFAEWVAFFLEVVVLLAYYFYWERMRESHWGWHVALGWTYVAMAVISATLISGVLGFMLTSDDWLQSRSLSAAFFNPTFWPQLGLRLAGGMALGGLLGLGFVLFTRRATPPVRQRIRRLAAGWALIGGLLAAGLAWVYFRAVPQTFATHTVFAVLGSRFSQEPRILLWANLVAAAAILAALLVAFARRTWPARLLIVPALILAVGMVAEFERVREFIRGPYLMPGYMYANQITLDEHGLVQGAQTPGLLARSTWLPAAPGGARPDAPSRNAGHALFMANCAMCHTVGSLGGGLNDIRDRVRGRTLAGIAVMIQRAERMVPFMPPFTGSEAERLTMAAYLYELGAGEAAPGTDPAPGVQRSVWAVPPLR